MLEPDLTLNAILPHPVCSGTCHPTEFRCRNGCCIDSFLECDDTPDCPDASDEATCEKCEDWEREGRWAAEGRPDCAPCTPGDPRGAWASDLSVLQTPVASRSSRTSTSPVTKVRASLGPMGQDRGWHCHPYALLQGARGVCWVCQAMGRKLAGSWALFSSVFPKHWASS